MQVFACFFVHRDMETQSYLLTMTMTMTFDGCFFAGLTTPYSKFAEWKRLVSTP